MKLENVRFSNYRSLRNSELQDCEDLNILIGKNNSGKSNALLGILFFFEHLGSAYLSKAVRTSPGQSLLFSQGGESADTARVGVSLRLSEAEIANLIGSIEQEAPHVKNTLDVLRGLRKLEVSMKVVSIPQPVAYIESIELAADDESTKRPLIDVSEAVGLELVTRHLSTIRLENDIAALERNAARLLDSESSYSKSLRLSRATDALSESVRLQVRRDLESLPPEQWRSVIEAQIAEWAAQLEDAQSEALQNRLSTFAGESSSIPKYIVSLVDTLAGMRVLYLRDRRNPVGAEEAEQLLRLKMQRGGDVELQAIQSTVRSLLGVQVDAYASSQPRRPAAVRAVADDRIPAEIDVDNFLVQMNGSGVREALRLILDVRFTDPDILLVEEPEVHLHPALEFNVLQYLREQSRERQIFATTHSTNFVDSAEATSVFLVSRNSATDLRKLAAEEFDQEIPKELGLRLSSVFMYDRLVFVEGPSDEAALRQFAFRLGVDLGRHGVGFIRMGGARNFAHYANASTIAALSKRQVRIWFVIDRDERTEDEVKRLADQCGELAKLHVLKRRELENYLLDEDALAAFVSKKTQAKTAPTVSEIRETLESVADELRDTTVARVVARQFCAPLYFDQDAIKRQTLESLPSATAIALEEMAEKIKSLAVEVEAGIGDVERKVLRDWDANKLTVVPGTELIDGVAKRFGCRYRKDRDGALIASLIRKESINSEIGDLLYGIIR